MTDRPSTPDTGANPAPDPNAPAAGTPGGPGPRQELAAGAVLIGLSLFVLLWLIPNHTGEATDDLEVAPGFFPQIAAVSLLVLSVLLVGHRLVRFPKLRSIRPATDGLAVLSEIAILAAGGLLVAWALGAVGYLVVAPAVMLAGLLAGGERRWWVIALVIAGMTAATWFGADLLFGVVLP
ncbi:MAG: tripartite tricarboxylate transporter TctB family protein [Rhodospirillaceae bacterium]|nr:tripartite tricarboxylate transporter TctB family protein [Rhodospirillaceae bacterium]MDE0619918.1 tripartite tricarboxylate transporter TctB family protein [Rhodospirillaceae bacterium]